MSTIEMVREGMDVLDAGGDKVGEVRAVSLGDPEAITAEGQQVGNRAPLLDDLRAALTSAGELPDERAERLLRLGFVQIDRPLLQRDLYVSSEELDRVEGDTLYLSTSVSE